MLHTTSGSGWPFDLCRNSCLRSLQLELVDADNAATLATQMLSQISAARIEEVGLTIGSCEDEILDQAIWNEIDAALQHPSFSGLNTVSVRLVPWEGFWDSSDVFLIMDRMPQCHARGILHVCNLEWQYSYFYLDRVHQICHKFNHGI
jgi:hypothetical protein